MNNASNCCSCTYYLKRKDFCMAKHVDTTCGFRTCDEYKLKTNLVKKI